MNSLVRIRFITPDDDLAALTEVIHAAYAKRASSNLRYWATYQSVEDTAKRLQSGQGLMRKLTVEWLESDRLLSSLNSKSHFTAIRKHGRFVNLAFFQSSGRLH